jgi:hypothetical protein
MSSDAASLSDADVISLWIRRNRGVCVGISRDFGVSKEFVRQILYGLPGGKSADLQIEKALIEAGAPFVADRISGAICG